MLFRSEKVLGQKTMAAVCRRLHDYFGIMLWTPSVPGAYNVPDAIKTAKLPDSIKTAESSLKVVYFPSCINQMMGLPANSPVKRPLVEETVELLKKGGYEVIFPENMAKLCCGTIWESKGAPEIADRKTEELEKALWEATERGKYPVLCDQSPCLHRMREHIKSMRLYEPAEFINTFLKERLTFHQSDTPVAVHLTCSTKLMKADEA